MSFYCAIQAFNVDRLDVIYTGSDRSFTTPSGLFKWAIAKIDRKCFKESFIDNTFSKFAAFSNLSPRLVIIFAMSLQHDFATPSSFLLVPLAFSPCPDANGRIDFLTMGHWVA